MTYDIRKIPNTVILGNEGESNAEQIEFDLSYWAKRYGDVSGTAYINYHSPDGKEYPTAITEFDVDNPVIVWDISEVDTDVPGYGYAEVVLQWDVDRVKSIRFQTLVYEDATSHARTELQNPSWVDVLIEKLDNALNIIDDSAPRDSINKTWSIDKLVEELAQGGHGIIPTRLSQLDNDMGFIDVLVDDLVNYYAKSEVYDKDEITQIIADFVQDENYVHTDNNYTNLDKSKLAGIDIGATRTIPDESTIVTNANGTISVNGSLGSNVEWNQLTLEGTKIAQLTIDGIPTDVFAPTSGGGSGATSLGQLSDVALSTLINEQFLSYNASTGKWSNKGVAKVVANPTYSGTIPDLTSIQIEGINYAIPEGQEVSFSRIVDSGTKIGTLTIDDSTYDIYVPQTYTKSEIDAHLDAKRDKSDRRAYTRKNEQWTWEDNVALPDDFLELANSLNAPKPQYNDNSKVWYGVNFYNIDGTVRYECSPVHDSTFTGKETSIVFPFRAMGESTPSFSAKVTRNYALIDDITDIEVNDTLAYLSDVYRVGDELSTALNAKANANSVYTKTQTDELLADKADFDDIPSSLSELTADATHRTVTDTEKSTWNSKQDALPDISNDKFLHTNSLTGQLEWSDFEGGSIVGWNQLTTSGTKIAQLTIDGVPTDIFAPTSGGSTGATSLGQLEDVALSSLQANQYLQYAGNNRWVNKTFDNVIANPVISSSDSVLESIQINGVKFAIPQGQEITFNQIVDSGTKLATITINDVDYDIYAPLVDDKIETIQVAGNNLPISNKTVNIPKASNSTLGVVKPDGTTTTVDSNGVIHAVSGTSGASAIETTKEEYEALVASGEDLPDTFYLYDDEDDEGTTVVANPTIVGNENILESIQIGDTKYKINNGGSGTTPTITATATVNASTGIPSVTVNRSGTDENPSFAFAFSNLKGDKGDDGADGTNGVNGADGDSAYAIAVEHGFVGTEYEWLESLKGAKGDDGADGQGVTVTLQSGVRHVKFESPIDIIGGALHESY